MFLLISLFISTIGGILVYKDVKKDPYQLLELFKIQLLLYWRVQGPLITRQPYIYHYPEGMIIQNRDDTRTLPVSNSDLISGKTLLINTKTAQFCEECNGKRNKPLTVHIQCEKCQEGRIWKSARGLTIPIPCNQCLGTGWIPVEPCTSCNGKGVRWENRKIPKSLKKILKF